VYSLGLDLGGTNVKGAVIDTEGRIISQVEEATPPGKEVKEIVVCLADMIERLASEHPEIIGVGLGSPGILDAERKIIRASPNFPSWSNVLLIELIARYIKLPLILENDANCFALAEHRWGAGRGCRHLLALTIGTGIGGGIIIDGELYRGSTGAGGELGHISIDMNGPKCSCGSYGCIERYIGSRWFVEAARQKLSDSSINSPKDVNILSSAGNHAAADFIAKQGELLGIACVSLINIFDPQAIIIGGGIAELGDPFFRGIRHSVNERSYLKLASEVKILPADLGTKAGALGAAALGFEAGRIK